MNQRHVQPKRAVALSARQLAVTVLVDVDTQDAYANIALNQRLRDANLSPSDAAFATELVSGTLRMRLLYDAVISSVAKRPTTEIDALTLNILRIGAHQLLSLGTGAHAAVNESVNLQRSLGKQSATGFVNGVLRQVSRHTLEEWTALLEQECTSEDARLALRFSHPEWIIRAFRDALTSENSAGELVELLTADNTAPKVSLALLPGFSVNETLLQDAVAQHRVQRSGVSPIGLELAQGSPRALTDDRDLATRGVLRVQDQGSQLVALALTSVAVVTPHERWLDLCAGPGGKSAILGAAAIHSNSTLRAVELAEHRAQLVQDAVSASADAVTVVSADGTTPSAYDGVLYDRILVDAPCTGLGALRRRPEARHRKRPADVAPLSALQERLLSAAVEHVKPGGYVAYVTCSPHLAETRVVVDRVLRSHPELTELDAKAVLQTIAREPLNLSGPALSAQLWPHRNGTDAMFIALLQRRLDS